MEKKVCARYGTAPEPPTTSHPMTALDWLYGTQLFGIKLGLTGMQQLVAELKIPPQRCIHVAGTNGKGSTCAMIASMAQAAGLRVGLYTSPHLISFTERIQINGHCISPAQVEHGLTRIRELVADWESHPTFFEITTALALAYFAEQRTELIVLETGMGGRLDATNVVTPLASVITPIALDHQQWLGQTLEEIAAEKAGIIKPGVPCVSASQMPGVAAVLLAHGPVEFLSTSYTASPLALRGPHQSANAALAVAALTAASYHFPPDVIARGLAQTTWPGRFQFVRPDLIIDGAHNPAGVAALVKAWTQHFPQQQAHLIFGAVAAKDVLRALEILLPHVARVQFVTLSSPRAMPAAELLEIWWQLGSTVPAGCPTSLAQALALAGSPTLVAGSLYLAGEALALCQSGRAFEVSAQ